MYIQGTEGALDGLVLRPIIAVILTVMPRGFLEGHLSLHIKMTAMKDIRRKRGQGVLLHSLDAS